MNLPGLFDQIHPEGMDGFRRNTCEPVAGINRPGGAVAFMGPERHIPVAHTFGEIETGAQQGLGNSGPPPLWHDVEEAQLGSCVIDADAKGSWSRRKSAMMPATSGPKVASNPSASA